MASSFDASIDATNSSSDTRGTSWYIELVWTGNQSSFKATRICQHLLVIITPVNLPVEMADLVHLVLESEVARVHLLAYSCYTRFVGLVAARCLSQGCPASCKVLQASMQQSWRVELVELIAAILCCAGRPDSIQGGSQSAQLE